MTIIDSLQNLWGTDSATDVSSDSSINPVSTDSTNGSSESAELAFGSLLSLLQGNDSDTGTDSGVDASIESIQQSLLSAVGLDGFSGGALSQLSSLSSLSNMQTSLLSSLQSSLFQAGTASAIASVVPDNVTSALTSDLSQVDTATTFLSSIEELSTYSVGEDGLGMDDLFDTVNVLNHIPVIADIYQDATDTIVDPISDIVGGYAYGGTLGMAYAAVDLAVEAYSGKSIYENIADYIFDDPENEALGEAVTQITDAVVETNKSYSFVTRDF